MNLTYSSSILCKSDAFPLALETHSYLISMGYAPPSIKWGDETPVFMGRYEGKLIGCILYTVMKRGEVWIYLGTIVKEHRQEGLYKELHLAFQKKMKADGHLTISSLVHKDNKPMIEAAGRVGYRHKFIKMGLIL